MPNHLSPTRHGLPLDSLAYSWTLPVFLVDPLGEAADVAAAVHLRRRLVAVAVRRCRLVRAVLVVGLAGLVAVDWLVQVTDCCSVRRSGCFFEPHPIKGQRLDQIADEFARTSLWSHFPCTSVDHRFAQQRERRTLSVLHKPTLRTLRAPRGAAPFRE